MDSIGFSQSSNAALFKQCTVKSPFHHRARKMLILTQLSLARLTDAADELRLARQLFPEDIDFILLDGLCKAARLQLDEALSAVQQSGLDGTVIEQWQQACQDLHRLVTNPDVDTGMGELDTVQLADLLETISSQLVPLCQQRRWRLPLQTESQFASLLKELPKQLPVDAHRCIDAVEAMAKIHPEASLLIVSGGLRLSVCNADRSRADQEIPQFEMARACYREALQHSGFLKHDDQMIWKAIFTSSTIPGITMKHDAEENCSQILESAAQIRINSINKASHARTFVILTMDLGDFAAAARWVDRWMALDDRTTISWQDAVWHQAVLCQRLEHWSDVLHWCDVLLESNPNYPEVVPLRQAARAQLQKLLSDKAD